jgi:hypothetical protein
MTARLAWHDDGWNGSVCSHPERNTYCVGCKSYPGDVIAETRILSVERKFAGVGGKALLGKYTPPCSYSYNAFGLDEAPAASEPPSFFYDGAKRREWTLEPATVSAWPYDAMYDDNVRAKGYLDNDQRRANAIEFFKAIESGPDSRSLIFYYTNYSNPFSEEDAPKYVLVGVSRVLRVGEELRYEDVSPQIGERYAGGMVWARDVRAAYPTEGLRLPYHLYRDNPDLLRKIALFPEDPQLCKMGSRRLSDDNAIGLLEQFLAKVRELRELDDKSENWLAREEWLSSQIATLWRHRGIYPGLLRSLEIAGAKRLIPAVKEICATQGEQKAKELAYAALKTGVENDVSKALTASERQLLKRGWGLKEDDEQQLLEHVLPRFELTSRTMKNLLSEDSSEFGIVAPLAEISENPYLIAEQYRGEDADDIIPWSVIDRGVLPAPDLGGDPLADVTPDDARRFRGLCVDHLRREPNHTFRFTDELLGEISQRIAGLPDWKQATFKDRFFEVDADFLDGALEVTKEEGRRIAYLKSVWEDERQIESTIASLLARPALELRRPVTEADWKSWVYKSTSVLARAASEEYAKATDEQMTVCHTLLPTPFAVVTGAAGTGKTTYLA